MSDDETLEAGAGREQEPADDTRPVASGPAPTEPANEAAPDELANAAGSAAPAAAEAGSGGAGLRVLGAAVTLPWLMLYGVTGVSAVTRAAQAYSAGNKRVDAGYTRFVTPGELAFFGALLLAAFAVMMACALFLLFRRRSAAAWLPLLFVAAGLTAGAVWAGVSGGLHPLLWVLLFFGLVYVTVIALVSAVKVTRAGRRGRIAAP
jgi:hypothetical protein